MARPDSFASRVVEKRKGFPHEWRAASAGVDLQRLLTLGRYRWLLNGHSHQRMVRDFGGLTLINAGTLRHDQEPCFLEADFEQLWVDVRSFDYRGQLRALVERVPIPKA